MINRTILKTLEEIEKRPGMFLVEPNFTALKNFLIGYFTAIENVSGINHNILISQWLSKQSKRNNSLIWPDHIFYHMTDQNEEQAFKLVFESLRRYFKEYDQDIPLE